MIVIPMAGLSRRFTEAGYKLPKYMLPVGKKTVFSLAVGSFEKYFTSEKFVFIARDVENTKDFIEFECKKMGITDFETIILNTPTQGQAETVELGIVRSGYPLEAPLCIFNIDTFRKNFSFPSQPWFAHSDGYLEVFKGSGQNWSYVEPAKDSSEPRAVRTAEKDPISDLCCDGLYYFAHASDFLWALEKEKQAPSMPELYIAPLYNHLIKRGNIIHYNLINKSDVVFCGVPKEYQDIINKFIK
ncbi:glycosyltransferase family 2 protein [Acetobacter pasteurianus]|uniref:dTDP-glucose pyrophosphorylase n=1 Tax=Acetobacter pasteurianus (strain NBRC 105184 / IFO 3283-01) TaxID=634452 RepID=C7JC95_ACEP3|nr:glycosyltransferase family 2 protein [Acetobacter pasteurianus]BAH99923.1 dTDP-glucose pyrophosphorylase [Acetobacter pasteurianus IFO 3283-01]BAI02976.1 dTDP-glucose pyrophosphorylase [Acetobacter pasteurianus IFO 3283-03]BAI06022.1 dTDP-glucose pyrophosphorylase [Acetobacter pasteurianus IFO 3283-07]BAI09071.1 dTDP-glucose pyrophosphorylase [Acetobacter pasteurianus IFO 3283-22]BAI12119.1 dTDP-glucose pyrophosphorylase [Acetobacter pasteurianus IFO 3283-26]